MGVDPLDEGRDVDLKLPVRQFRGSIDFDAGGCGVARLDGLLSGRLPDW
jgi:hypothetical protein